MMDLKYIDPTNLVKDEITNGRLWAESFCRTAENRQFTMEDIDVDLMTAWFASAIVVAEDKIRRKDS